MVKTVKKNVKIKDIYFDKELYPRVKPNWLTIYDYKESMLSGAQFPPITLALLNNKMYLVDGKHRIEAMKHLGLKDIKSIINVGWSKKKIFQEAVKSNISHGQPLSPYEKRRIAVKLLEMRMSYSKVSDLIQISMDKLDNFIGERMVNSITGEVVSDEDKNNAYETGSYILKSNLKHLAGNRIEGNIDSIQKKYYSRNQVIMLKEFISILENNIIDLSNKEVIKLVTRIKKLLRKIKV